jgi:hypothetical protein
VTSREHLTDRDPRQSTSRVGSRRRASHASPLAPARRARRLPADPQFARQRCGDVEAKWKPKAVTSVRSVRGSETKAEPHRQSSAPMTHSAHATTASRSRTATSSPPTRAARTSCASRSTSTTSPWKRVRAVSRSRQGGPLRPRRWTRTRWSRLSAEAGPQGRQHSPAGGPFGPSFELPVAFADVYEQEQVRVAAISSHPEIALFRPEYLRFGASTGDMRIRAAGGVRIRWSRSR